MLSFSSNGRKPANWASTISDRLGLDFTTVREETLALTAPDGEPWALRLLVTDQPPSPPAASRAVAPVAHTAAPLPLPVLSAQHDTDATVTDLALFVNCPREYYLSRYIGFRRQEQEGPLGESADPPAAELGSQVHALLAGQPLDQAHPEAVRLAAVFRRSALGRRAERACPVEREFAFLLAVEDLVIRGQIDLWFEESGELVIVDYKTDAVSAADAPARARRYELQLRLYAMAVEQLAGRPPDRAILHFLRPNSLVEVDLSPSLWGSPEQIVRDFIDAQSRREFPLHVTAHCLRCEHYGNLCPAVFKP